MRSWRPSAMTSSGDGGRPERPAWALRAALGLLLAGLVATSIAVSVGAPTLQRVATAPPGTAGAATGRAVATRRGAPPSGKVVQGAPPSAPSTTAGASGSAPAAGSGSAPAAGSGSAPAGAGRVGTTPPVTRVSPGCGLSLSPDAPTVAVGHCTVLEVGDSLGNDLGWGLARELSATSGLHLVQADVSSTGLANRAFYDWPAHLAADLRRYHPELVVISLGGNDEQGMMVGGHPVQFATPAWTKAYLERVSAMVGESAGAGAYVCWVGMPVMEQPGFSSGMQFLDSLYRKVVAGSPRSAFLPTWGLFAGPRGQFEAQAEVNGTPSSVRQADGVHYSFVGEDVLATYVIRHLSTIFHVRLAPTDPAVITGWG